MARRYAYVEEENHARWLVSYADFITLLFALFVVMYAISSVNEGKHRVLSDTLMAAFENPQLSLDSIQSDDDVRSLASNEDSHAAAEGAEVVHEPEGLAPVADAVDELTVPGGDAQDEMPLLDMKTVTDQLQETMAPLIDDDLVRVGQEQGWVEVEINSSALFASGSARIAPAAIDVLAEVADILRGVPNPIRVEGFTDNVPINTVNFPSNWELSAARAASVVHLFMKYGVPPERMVALGYGEYRPIAKNDTEQGRNKNRRVVIVIATGEQAKRDIALQQMSDLVRGVDPTMGENIDRRDWGLTPLDQMSPGEPDEQDINRARRNEPAGSRCSGG